MPVVATTPRPPAALPAPAVPGLPLRRLAFPALGTECRMQFVAPGGEDQAADFSAVVEKWTQRFEARYSRFRADSLVGRINAAAGRDWVEVDAEMEQLCQVADTVGFMTQGILDPTILPLLRLWNWRATPPRLPGADEIAAARRLVGWSRVQRAPGRMRLPEAGMALDFGGFGKEYAVDAVAELARARGIPAALVDFGHDLFALGAPPARPAWHVGLENPREPGTATGSVGLRDLGIASSGDYLRSFTIAGRRYGHIVDPRTGWPVAHGGIQATVIAGSCLQAGVLATAAFVLGVPAGLDFIQSFPGAEGLLLTGKVRAQTRGFFQHVAT